MASLSIETKKISELNAAAAVSGNDAFIVDTTANGTQKLTFSALVNSLETTDNNRLVQSIKKDMQFALGFSAYGSEITLSNLLTAIRSGDPFAYNLGDYLTINSKKWVVIEKNYYSPIVTSTPHALLMMYDCIDTTGQMYNSTATNAGGYGSSALKTYLEGTFWNSLPSEFRSAIATVSNIRESTKTSAQLQVQPNMLKPGKRFIKGFYAHRTRFSFMAIIMTFGYLHRTQIIILILVFLMLHHYARLP